jgi:hypothetical protein
LTFEQNHFAPCSLNASPSGSASTAFAPTSEPPWISVTNCAACTTRSPLDARIAASASRCSSRSPSAASRRVRPSVQASEQATPASPFWCAR